MTYRLADFISISTREGVVYKKNKGGKGSFLAIPFSEKARSFHRGLHSNRTEKTEVDSYHFHLINIQGIISSGKMNPEFLNAITNTSENRVIAVTETHLKKEHGNAEVLKAFEDFNLFRADRNLEYDLTDDYQLKSKGGYCLYQAQVFLPENHGTDTRMEIVKSFSQNILTF